MDYIWNYAPSFILGAVISGVFCFIVGYNKAKDFCELMIVRGAADTKGWQRWLYAHMWSNLAGRPPQWFPGGIGEKGHPDLELEELTSKLRQTQARLATCTSQRDALIDHAERVSGRPWLELVREHEELQSLDIQDRF